MITSHIRLAFLIFLCAAVTVQKIQPTRGNDGEATVDNMSQKVARGSAKRALTREVNLTRQRIAEGCMDCLGSQKEKLTVLFSDFEKKHEIFHSKLVDDGELDESDLYFSQVQNNYISVLEQIKSVSHKSDIETKPQVPTPEVQNVGITKELLSFLNMPKVELETFSGDPLQFHQFIKSFETNVDSMPVESSMKLTRLIQYTAGDAREAIRSCQIVGGDEGYKQAKDILKKRYGNPHLVAERIISDLCQKKPVKTPHDIQQFSDSLTNAHMVLAQLKMLNEVSSQSIILEIVGRLQPYIQIKWKDRALATKKSKGSYPDFHDFVKFMTDVAVDVNDPVYGNLLHKPVAQSSKPIARPSNFSSSLDNRPHPDDSQNRRSYARPEQACTLCSEHHRLWHCDVFKRMTPRERLDLVTQHKLCENCLLASHDTVSCGKKSVCGVPGCGKRHTMYIHVDSVNPNRAVSHDVSSTNVSTGNKVRHCYMPIVCVQVNDRETVFALLDTGSSNSFCTSSLAKRLRLRGQSVSYQLDTLSKSAHVDSRMVSLSVSADSGEVLNMSGVFIVDSIPAKSSLVDVSQYAHLSDVEVCPFGESDQVDLLIGQDFAEALVPLEVRKGKVGDPFAIRTILGWVVNGQSSSNQVNRRVVSHFVTSMDITVSDQIHDLWKLENDDLDEIGWSSDDRSVLALWEGSCTKVGGHYQLPIPWKNRDRSLPNNYVLAKSRLESTVKRLHRENRFDRYDAEVRKLLDSGYAEQVPIEDIHSTDRIWYLPHHPVVTVKKPDKVRIVFDCAAKFRGESLNDKCLQGPDLVNKLLPVLLRFRQFTYAVQADVEAMYHQVRIPPEDRDALRFLWVKDGEIVCYRMTSHLFGGVWCASSSTFALKRTVFDCDNVSTVVSRSINKDFYVDDFLKSLRSRDEVKVILNEVPRVLLSGGFNLTKFVVNDEILLEQVPESHRAKEVESFCPSSVGKVLGIRWNISSDVFCFDVSVDSGVSMTRRKMLSVVSSMYDPLGFVGPHVLLGKLLFQDATRLCCDWDQTVPGVIQEQWIKWVDSLDDLKSVQVPRCLQPDGFVDSFAELHHFSDASESAYGCCSYLRCVNKRGQIHSRLVLSKNRVAPLKTCTIPRLELQAAVMAVKVDVLLKTQLEIEIDSSYFWVDSEIVLAYIANHDKRFQVFVENRVSFIRQNSSPGQWHHIPGTENPADVLSRGRIFSKLETSLWFSGPEFLRTYKSQWDRRDKGDVPLEELEIRKAPVRVLASEVNDVSVNPVQKLSNHYSDWLRMKRGVAWLIKFVSLLHTFIVEKSSDIRKHMAGSGVLSVEDINKAQMLLVKSVQISHFPREIDRLVAGKPVLLSSDLRSLCPFLDSDGVLRVGGRLGYSALGTKHPVILPGKHHISESIIRYVHNRAHVGAEWTLSLVRQHFWITRGRSVVRKLVRSCVMCRKLFGKAECQIMAHLPVERVQPGKAPFSCVGIDLFGSFMVKVGRSDVKRYGCMFTCFTSRAVHIEVLQSLETDSFINGLRRFIARRGQPEKIFSDNGTNLVGANTELKRGLKALSQKEILAYSVQSGFEWHFNPPAASHMGGLWERMIRCARKVLSGLLCHPVRLTDEILQTVFAEVESIINSRPITKLSEDPNDHVALTPNHLLLLRSGSVIPPGKFSGDSFRRRWRFVQHLADQFWHKWVKLYLPELQSRSKWTRLSDNLCPGDLVLLIDGNLPRNLWPLALVVDISEGRDGNVRSVRIRTRNTELVRPITKVVLLEGASDR